MTATRSFITAGAWSILSACLLATASAQSSSPTTAYAQPDPSADEQFMLERINIARSNPPAEGIMLASISDPNILQYYSYYGVSTAALISSFASYPAVPPLAMNPMLMNSALRESTDMATHGFQSHTGSDGSTFTQRISDAGYQWIGAGENIYAYSEDALFGHIAFNADWGVPSLDHRANIMNFESTSSIPMYREVGVSCVATTATGYGPMVITQDFGEPADATVAYVLGVVYNDANANGSYDQGEGLAGVTVMPNGGSYYAVTATAGGFVIPLPASGSGTMTITASGGGLGAARVKTINWTAGTNVKVDFTTADAASSGPQPQAITPTHPAFFTGQSALGNGAYYLQFANGNYFGYYSYLANSSYIYHYDLGYEYVMDANDGQSGVYLYDFASNSFFYSSPSYPFPYLYDFSLNSVLYYYPNTSNPGHYNTNGERYFYNCSTGQVITL
jgi:hypothetical protein